jgi:hypothetical protein
MPEVGLCLVFFPARYCEVLEIPDYVGVVEQETDLTGG